MVGERAPRRGSPRGCRPATAVRASRSTGGTPVRYEDLAAAPVRLAPDEPSLTPPPAAPAAPGSPPAPRRAGAGHGFPAPELVAAVEPSGTRVTTRTTGPPSATARTGPDPLRGVEVVPVVTTIGSPGRATRRHPRRLPAPAPPLSPAGAAQHDQPRRASSGSCPPWPGPSSARWRSRTCQPRRAAAGRLEPRCSSTRWTSSRACSTTSPRVACGWLTPTACASAPTWRRAPR